MDTSQIIKDCEDHLFPKMELSLRERSMYYHLLRHTHLDGRESALVAIFPLSKAIGYSETSAREDIRSLNEKGCIVIEDRSRKGHLVRVLLPREIGGIVPESVPDETFDIDELDFYSNRQFLDALLDRDDHRCFYCLKTLQDQSCELDHLIARANTGDNSYRNIVCSCHDCNTTKQDRDPEDFVRSLYRDG